MGSPPPGGYSTVSIRPSLPGMSVRSFDKTCVTLGSLVTSGPVGHERARCERARCERTRCERTRCERTRCERTRCEKCQHQNYFCGRHKLTYLSTRTLRCGLSEPGFEASRAEPSGFFRHECSEAQLRP